MRHEDDCSAGADPPLGHAALRASLRRWLGRLLPAATFAAIGLALWATIQLLRLGAAVLSPGNLEFELHVLEVVLLSVLALDLAMRTAALAKGPTPGIRCHGSARLHACRDVVVGSDPRSAGIALTNTLVSRRHLRLRKTEDGRVEATDLESRNGSHHNGQDLRECGPVRLKIGESIRLGATGPVVSVEHAVSTGVLPGPMWTGAISAFAAIGYLLGWWGNQAILPAQQVLVGDVVVSFAPFVAGRSAAIMTLLSGFALLLWNLAIVRARCPEAQLVLHRAVQVLVVCGAVLLYPLLPAQGAHYARLARSAFDDVGQQSWQRLREAELQGQSPCVQQAGDATTDLLAGITEPQRRRFCAGRRHLRLAANLASRGDSAMLGATYFRQASLLLAGVLGALVLPLFLPRVRQRIGQFTDGLQQPVLRRMPLWARRGRVSALLGEFLYRDMLIGLFAAALLLLTVWSPLGSTLGRGRRLFLTLPGFGAFQTIELVKVLFLLFLVGYFGRRGRSLQAASRVRYLAPFLLAVGGLLAIIGLQGDMGGLLMMSLFLIAAFVACGGPTRLLLVLPTMVAAGLGVAIVSGRADVVLTRLGVWWSPTTHASGHQIVQARQLLLSSGALGFSPAKTLAWKVPDIHGDLAVAALAERFGAVGLVAVLVVTLVVTATLLILASRIEGSRSIAFAAVAALLLVQVVTQTGGILGLLPFTGAPFPWLSQGLSGSLVFTLLLGLAAALASDSTCARALPKRRPRRAASAARPRLLVAGCTIVALALLALTVFWMSVLPGGDQIGERGRSYRWIDTARREQIQALVAADLFRVQQGSSIVNIDFAVLERLQRSPIDITLPPAVELLDLAEGLRWSGSEIVPLAYEISIPNRFADRSPPRGRIVDRDGVALAFNDVRGRRRYPLGQAGFHPIGRSSGVAMGSGVEDAAGELLRGEGLSFAQRLRAFRHDVHQGADVRLTLHTGLQRTAFDLLEGRTGAAVVLDTSDGAVLAMASSPAASPSSAGVSTWRAISRDPTLPLINRAIASTRAYSPPGSAFKPVVALAALTDDTFDPDATSRCDGSDDELSVMCPTGHAHGDVDLGRALAVSCNVYFARLAVRLGADRIRATAGRLGLHPDRVVDLLQGSGFKPLRGLPARIAPDDSFLATPSALARIGFGQGPVSITPLQLARVASAIATHGWLRRPYLVAGIELSRATDGASETVWQRKMAGPPAIRAIDAADAVRVDRYLSSVFRDGGTAESLLKLWDGRDQGWRLADESPGRRWQQVPVAGKTGSAWKVKNDPASDSWIMAWAPATAPRVVVVVLIEDVGSGTSFAGPVAMRLLRQSLEYLSGYETAVPGVRVVP